MQLKSPEIVSRAARAQRSTASQKVQRSADHAARRASDRHPSSIYDFDVAATAPPAQLEHFDRAIQMLQTNVASASATVQRRAGDGAPMGAGVHEAAAQGTRSGGGQIPHKERIQRAFGRHDIGGVQAHVGGAAKSASSAIGAEAYATGNHVAFGNSPDLHTAAHEAAHVVQQRAGVQLSGGVGKLGDTYERHADAVADAVVQGKSAEALLGPVGSSRGGDAQQRGVQLKGEANVGLDMTEGTFAVGGSKILADIPVFYAPIWGPLGVQGSLTVKGSAEMGNAISGKGAQMGKIAGKLAAELGVMGGLILPGIGNAGLGGSLVAEASGEVSWNRDEIRIVLTGVKISLKGGAKLNVGEVLDHDVTLAKGDLIQIGQIVVSKAAKAGWKATATGVTILNPTFDRFVNEYRGLTASERQRLGANKYVLEHPNRGQQKMTE